MVGKWHIGFREGLRPWERGFDYFYGFLSVARTYMPGNDDKIPLIRNGKSVMDEKEYLTDAFARESEAFIDRSKDKPFFLYLAFNAVHLPLQATKAYENRFPNIGSSKRKTYAGMTAAMDDAVGRVLARLRKYGLEKNTLVFFYSDNGGPTGKTTSRNDPFRGFKGNVWEGGVRVPFMVQWPGQLPAGEVYREMVMGFDVHATALTAAGIPMPTDKPLDGVNLIPFLIGKDKGSPHDQLFWRSGEQKYAARVGDWKLVQEKDGEPELYNLKRDIGETKNLANSHPEALKAMQTAYAEWDSQMVDAKWIRQDRDNAEVGGKLNFGAGKGRDQFPQTGQATLNARFRGRDRNGDGKLTRDEVPQTIPFDQWDANKDGVVTLEEFKTFYAKPSTRSLLREAFAQKVARPHQRRSLRRQCRGRCSAVSRFPASPTSSKATTASRWPTSTTTVSWTSSPPIRRRTTGAAQKATVFACSSIRATCASSCTRSRFKTRNSPAKALGGLPRYPTLWTSTATACSTSSSRAIHR